MSSEEQMHYERLENNHRGATGTDVLWGGFKEAGVALMALGVLLLAASFAFRPDAAPADDPASSRVRYPGEEAAAKAACGSRRLMYWWLEDPRKDNVTLHVRCAGQVRATRELKL